MAHDLTVNEEKVRAAFYKLRGSDPRDSIFVGLAALREELSDLTREQQDDAIKSVRRKGFARIIPVANTKALKERDWNARLYINDMSPVDAITFTDEHRRPIKQAS